MIVLYDATGEAYPLTAYENFSITHKLDGCDEMTFYVDTHHEQYPLLYEEARVVTDENEWLIKKIDDDKVDCELNFDFLKETVYKDYKSTTRLLTEVLESHLPGNWTIQGGNAASIRRTIEFDFCTDYDVVYQCMSTYKVYLVWKIREKTVVVYSQTAMQPTGEYLTTELNLKSLSFKGETTDFATRLYAYGKEGMTMEKAVVDGKEYGLTYVENRKYVDKTVCAYWSDERYTVPENLYADALVKLETLASPVRSYECNVVDLAKRSAEYSFLDFKMHKKVTLIDVERGIRVEHQIVEYKEYPDEPDRNVVTLSCVPDTITTAISSAVSTIKEDAEKTKTDYDSRLAMATAMLTGAFGGHVYKNDSELFIMDNEDPALAQIVWRWNINGFGKSSTGIDGPYTTALTFNDEFITNVINAMVIRGSLIEAGSIQAGSISQSYTDGVLSQSYEAAEGLVKFESQKITDELTTKVEAAMTEEQVRILVERKIGEIDSVTTSTGFTFDENGLTVEKSGAGTKTKVDETGLTVSDANGAAAEELLYAGVDSETKESVVKAKNIRVSKYLIVGKNSRFEDYESDGEPRTGCFFIG